MMDDVMYLAATHACVFGKIPAQLSWHLQQNPRVQVKETGEVHYRTFTSVSEYLCRLADGAITTAHVWRNRVAIRARATIARAEWLLSYVGFVKRRKQSARPIDGREGKGRERGVGICMVFCYC